MESILTLMVGYLPALQDRTGLVQPTAAVQYEFLCCMRDLLHIAWKCLFRLLQRSVLTYLFLLGLI